MTDGVIVVGGGIVGCSTAYELAKDGERAVVDLGTPKGVDNVDAYRMMIQSFKWR